MTNQKLNVNEIVAKDAYRVLHDALISRRAHCIYVLKDMSGSALASLLPEPSLYEETQDGKILYFNLRTFVGLNDILKKMESIAGDNPEALWSIKWSGSECIQIQKALFTYPHVDYPHTEYCELVITHFCEMLDPHRYDRHE